MARRSRLLKYPIALKLIAACYLGAMRCGYRTDCGTVFCRAAISCLMGTHPIVGRQVPLWVACKENKMKMHASEQDMTSLSPADAERLRLAFLHCRDMDGTLTQQLEAYAAAGREIFPAYGAAVDRL